MASSDAIHRTTLFNIPNPDDQNIVLEQYREVFRTAQKDSKPYILSLSATRLSPDPRSQNYTIAIKTVFKNSDDMAYYDTQCEAHKKLKTVAGPRKVGDILTVWGKEEVSEGQSGGSG